MNNSQIVIQNIDFQEAPQKDFRPELRERQVELTKILLALDAIAGSEEWRTLKGLLFEGVVEQLEKKLLDEAKKKNPDLLEEARLQGQIAWAKRYANLESLGEIFKVELKNIKDRLKNA